MPKSTISACLIGLIVMTIEATSAQTVENYALYSQMMTELPEDHIDNIADPKSFKVEEKPDGSKAYVYEWDDLKITINLMPSDQISDHLNGFTGYVAHLAKQKEIPVDADLVDKILDTKMVLGFIVEPGMDAEGRANEVLGAITFNTQSLMFYADGVYDHNAQLIIGP